MRDRLVWIFVIVITWLVVVMPIIVGLTNESRLRHYDDPPEVERWE